MPAFHIKAAKKLIAPFALAAVAVWTTNQTVSRRPELEIPDGMPGQKGFRATANGSDTATRQVDAFASHLDQLHSLPTVAETWLDEKAGPDGTRRRVRIARRIDTGAMVRLEETVDAGSATPEIRVGSAMAAGHVLVGSRHTAALAKEGFPFEQAGSASYVRLPVADASHPAAIPELIGRLAARGITEVSPDGFVQATGVSGDPEVGSGISWHLENRGTRPGTKAGADVNATGAWEHRTDASPVLIALLDSGILHGEPELAESLYSFPGETAGDGIDNDGNGYVDDVHGYDFADRDADPTPSTIHGTACAALIGARGGNGTRSSGVAWKASILNCKVYSYGNLGELSGIIDAIDYAIASGAKIINLSWTYDAPSPLLEQALKRANDAGVILVCSAGNLNAPFQLPARIPLPGSMDLPLLVTVAASKPDDTLAYNTLVDPAKVDIAAPGVNVSLGLSGEGSRVDYYENPISGTSYATALVSGGLALAMAEHPDENPRQIVRRLLETVDPIPGGAAVLSSGGRMNVGRMLTAELPEVAHDHFADRRILTDPAGQWTGGNANAGIEPIDGTWSLKPAPARTLWFEWTAANTGTLSLSAAMTQGSATVRVFRESGGSPSVLAGQFLKGKPLAVAVTQGEKLFWMLDSATPSAAGLKVTWQLPPFNDSIVNAPVVTSLPALLTGTTLGATPDKFEGKKRWHTLNYPGQSIWWKFVPDRDMEVVVSVLGDNCNAYLLPAKPKAASFPKNYHYLNRAGVILPVQAGKTYAVLAVPGSVSSGGTVTLALTEKNQWVTATQPQDVSALPGEITGFRMNLLGHHNAPPVGVQWFKDDQPIDPWVVNGIVAGESTYGTYHATIDRGGVIETTRKAVLSRRHEAPRLIEAAFERSLIHGQHLALTPRFANPEGATFAWEKDGQPLAGENAVDLFRPDLSVADAGTYSLVATNAHGSTRVDFPVSVLETPWKRWLRQGDAEASHGSILQVAAEGNLTTALTPTAWLSSTDLGATWSVLPMPGGFTASTAARLPDGTLMVHGSYPGPLYYTSPATYRKVVGGPWVKVAIVATLPDGSREAHEPGELHSFDGKLYSRSWDRVLFSSDGLSWTPLTLPGQPGILPRFTNAHRFGNSLVFLYWNGNSDQSALVLKPGGSHEIVADDDYRQIWQVDGVHRGTPYNPHADFTELWSDPDGLLRGVSDDGDLFQGFEVGRLTQRGLGFTTYARTGNRWVLGYPDGTIWTGENLLEAPEKSPAVGASKLRAFGDEFIADGMQSSDGIRWQPLGPLTGEIAATTRDRFFLKHEIPFRHHFDDENLGMTFSTGIHPLAETGETSVHGFNTFWSGNDSVLMTRARSGSTQHRFVQILRPGANGNTVQESDLGVDWDFIHGVVQVGSRWYVDCDRITYPQAAVLIRSADGVAWERMLLMPGYRITGTNGFHVAAGVSHRVFRSTDGVAWKPHLMRGLPAAPDQVVSYRGHFIARVGIQLYVSTDGNSWFLGATDEPVAELAATRQGIVARTTGGRLLHPDAAAGSGPWLRLGPGYQKLSVPLHQPASFTLEAGDDDGDLVSVACYLDGELHATLTAAPFVFAMDTSETATRAVEFVARDLAGRTSRTTAVFKVLPLGVPESAPTILEPSDDRFVFKGKLYTRTGFYASTDGTLWYNIGPTGFSGGSLVTNDHALVAYNGSGLAVSHDGVTWTILNGFKTVNGAFTVEVHDNRFELRTASERWVSDDGLDWRPVTGVFHPSGITWCDSLHGLAGSASNWRVTTDGGKNWLTLQASFFTLHSAIVPVTGGYLIKATESPEDPPGIHFLGKDSRTFTRLAEGTAWDSPVFLQAAGDTVFFGVHGVSLFSTSDGVTISIHTPPPIQRSASYIHHGGEWLALTGGGFFASPDLATWRLFYDTTANSTYFPEQDLGPGVAYPHGDGSLVANTPNFLRRFVVIAPDLTVTQWPYRFGGGEVSVASVPGGYAGGKFFKGRVIAVDNTQVHTKPKGQTSGWEAPDLLQGAGYEPLVPHEWPVEFSHYDASTIFAATDQRFVMLVKAYNRNSQKDVVIRSDDGITFHVHDWIAPVTLEMVKSLAASADTFLATTTDGRVLKSTDGLAWTAHAVTVPTFSISTLHHFAGRWHAAGYHPYRWEAGVQIQAFSEIWSSTDGENWQQSWEGRDQPYTYSQSFDRAIVAHGSSWLHHARAGWMKSTDGLTWAIDPVAQPAAYGAEFIAIGAHPEGLIATHYTTPSTIHILDPATWQVRRSVDFAGTEIRPLDGWPFLKVPRNLLEWTEADPRLTALSAIVTGAALETRLTAAELPEDLVLHFGLSDDAFLGPPADLPLASVAWSAGTVQPDGSRIFPMAIPAGLPAGSYRVTASFSSTGLADIGIQNNLLGTPGPVVTVAGPPAGPSSSGQLPADLVSGSSVSFEEGHLVYRYQRPAGLAPESLPVPEYSADLVEWTPILPDGSLETVTGSESAETVEIRVPRLSGTSGFLRLRLPSSASDP